MTAPRGCFPLRCEARGGEGDGCLLRGTSHFPPAWTGGLAVPAGGAGHRVPGRQPRLGKDMPSPRVLVQGRDVPVPCPQWHRGQRVLTSMAGVG